MSKLKVDEVALQIAVAMLRGRQGGRGTKDIITDAIKAAKRITKELGTTKEARSEQKSSTKKR